MGGGELPNRYQFPFLDGKKKCPGNGLYNYMNTFEPTYMYTKKKSYYDKLHIVCIFL